MKFELEHEKVSKIEMSKHVFQSRLKFEFRRVVLNDRSTRGHG